LNEDKSLEELVRELPPELYAPVREGIVALLARHAHRAEEGERPGPDATVSLREITGETVRRICRLSDTLTPPKKYMVAPNAASIAEAYFQPKAWFRAIYADETPVGFVMLYDDSDEPEYFLWRFMIAEPYHGLGFGRRGLEQAIEYVRTRPGARELLTSCGQGEGSPEGFYHKLGFRRTGKVYGEEVGLGLEL
jgi:diamine N-acetyltransferase